MTPYSAFVADLECRAGAEAAALRHEMFFQGSGLIGLFQAWAALIRDAFLLSRSGCHGLGGNSPLAVLVTTLGGSSGWGTLKRALPAIAEAGLEPLVLAHPRLPESIFPANIPIVRPAAITPEIQLARLTTDKLGAARLRRGLWKRALANALAGHHGILLLHNDFDMMSSASLALGWPSICVQHGIPTDEYFPCQADFQVVWGESSAQAYGMGGTPPSRLIVDALDRALGAQAPQAPPATLAVTSQSHAKIFGPDLPRHLRTFIQDLRSASHEVTVLLHPNEKGRSPYGATPVSRPPHTTLTSGAGQPALVLAYCSTLLLDAALAGHWVAGIAFEIPGNQAARTVANPPLSVSDARDAQALFLQLGADPAFRKAAAANQERWLKDTFSQDRKELAPLLRQWVMQ